MTLHRRFFIVAGLAASLVAVWALGLSYSHSILWNLNVGLTPFQAGGLNFYDFLVRDHRDTSIALLAILITLAGGSATRGSPSYSRTLSLALVGAVGASAVVLLSNWVLPAWRVQREFAAIPAPVVVAQPTSGTMRPR
jgi:hypothetical protein